MPEYLAPGVFVEEISFRAKSIEGVSTNVAAIVGPTRFGSLQGKPEVITSFNEFTRQYGDLQDLTLGGELVLNHVAIAAKAFFDGGGKQLFVSRIGNFGPPTAGFASISDSQGTLTFRSRFPGAMGNFTLEMEWKDTENLLRSSAVAVPAQGETVYLEGTGLAAANLVNVVLPDGLGASLTVRALVHPNGGSYDIASPQLIVSDGVTTAVVAAAAGAALQGAIPQGGALRFTRVSLKTPAAGPVSNGTAATVILSGALDSDAELFTLAGANWGGNATVYGALNVDDNEFDVSADPVNAGATAFSLPLAALAAAPSHVRAILVQRSFAINVRSGGWNGPVVYTYGSISVAPTAANSLSEVLPVHPATRYDALTSPISCEVATGATGTNVMNALFELFDDDAMHPPAISVDGPRYLFTLANGADGDPPSAVHYGGVADEVNGSTGFAALEDIDDVSIVMTPAAAADPVNHQAIVAEVQKHCRKMRYCIGIVDSRDRMTLSEIRDFRSNFDDSRLALYYPWVVVADPRGVTSTISAPPSGFIAGVYANTDVQRGVHKPPANEVVIGALRFAQDVNRFQQELLNPDGVNCLRSFRSRGHRVWGGRTLSSDPEWKYVNVRRYFLYLERSIEKSTQWVVFEPNGENLWDNLRSTVESFLYSEWRNGRLLGSEKTAFFVRCDRSTMTQNDLDNGRLVCEVGVAALKPAEFVIFRVGQKTADA
jgi:uncharacterized protein